MRARGAGNDAELYFGLPDLRGGNGNAVMTSHRQLKTAAESGAVNGHDDRLAAIFNTQEQRFESFAARGFAGSDLAKFLDVRPSDKSAAAADEDSSLDAVVSIDFIHCGGDALGHARAKGVYGRIVDGDDGDAIFFCKLNQVAHFVSSLFLMTVCSVRRLRSCSFATRIALHPPRAHGR